MIKWELKRIVIRHLEGIGVIVFYIVAILSDETEKLLYEFKIPSSDHEMVKQVIYEMVDNNAKCLLYWQDDSVPEEIKNFANAKMHNFRDVNLEIDDTVPMCLGKFIGQDINKINNFSLMYLTEDKSVGLLNVLRGYPKLFEEFKKKFPRKYPEKCAKPEVIKTLDDILEEIKETPDIKTIKSKLKRLTK